jgi:hypothetical protein
VTIEFSDSTILVETDAMRDVIARDLYEIEHLERTCELEPDDVVAVRRHATPFIARSAG